MSKKTLLASILLFCVCVLFGAAVITGFNPTKNILPIANASNVTIGTRTPITNVSFNANDLSKAFADGQNQANLQLAKQRAQLLTDQHDLNDSQKIGRAHV